MNTKKVACIHTSIALATMIGALFLSGCAGNFSTKTTAPAVPSARPALRGRAMGGQQPIIGATLHLYAASTGGYAAPNTDLLTSAVQTDSSGSFDITNKYTCTAGQQIYLVALGGNPGAGINPQVGGMAGLGDCAGLSSITFISLNEVTTVAAVFALAPFMSGYANVGSSSTNTLGLAQAFTSANKLANFSSGQAGGPALAAGATVPTTTIYTLANILAACINSTGGTAGDNTTCGQLFSYATPAGGTAPTETIGLALAIAKNPGLNVPQIYVYDTPTGPFAPRLTATPNDWTLSIVYTAGGINLPRSVTPDAAGNIWIANAGSNTLTVLSAAGTPLAGSPYTGNGLNAPAAVAIDLNGNAWAANKGANTVSGFTPAGAAIGNYTVGSAPSALAFDAVGNLYVSNSGSNSISVLNSAGTTTRTITTSSAPSTIAISPR